MFDINITFFYESITFLLLVIAIRYIIGVISKDLDKRRQYINETLQNKVSLDSKIEKMRIEMRKEQDQSLKYNLQASKKLAYEQKLKLLKAEKDLKEKMHITRERHIKETDKLVRDQINREKDQLVLTVISVASEIKDLKCDLGDPATLQALKTKLENELQKE